MTETEKDLKKTIDEMRAENREILGDSLSDQLLRQSAAGNHYDACDCAACDGSISPGNQLPKQ